MGFEKNYLINNLSKQLNFNKRNFTTLNSENKLNPYFITGFSDGESSFITSIYKTKSNKIG
jgi:hypothetical protein